jgi:hypothetical protein
MDEVVTSRAACCCRYGALDNFGPADSGTCWAAPHSPQKIHEIRFPTLALDRPEFALGLHGARA